MGKPKARPGAAASARQYHLGCRRGDLAEKIILVGDPQRVDRAAALLDRVRRRGEQREFRWVTGSYRGVGVSVLGTGIGTDNTEIAVIEACQVTAQPTFIRCGSCGALQPSIQLGELIVTRGAVRLERTSSFFAEEEYPAVADPEVLFALAAACRNRGFAYHLGITASACGFYGSQGREVGGFKPRFPELNRRLAEQGVLNFEMESSTLFILCQLRGLRAGTICAVYGSRPRRELIAGAEKRRAERNCLRAGLDAMVLLERMDAEREAGSPLWLPRELREKSAGRRE
jgi:uridine phosphorylase